MLVACWQGRLSTCKWLYEVGAAADIRTVDKLGNPPLHTSCMTGQLHVCEWLVSVGAEEDLRSANFDGWTAMLQACVHGKVSDSRISTTDSILTTQTTHASIFDRSYASTLPPNTQQQAT